MLSFRPFPNIDDLQEKAGALFRSCDHEDWREAFAHHARLGQRKKKEKPKPKETNKISKQFCKKKQ